MSDTHSHDHEHHDEAELGELALETRTQVFLELREQNIELLRIATQVAGYGGEHGALKPGDVKGAIRSIWDVFAEFYAWVDPEDDSDGDEGEDDEG